MLFPHGAELFECRDGFDRHLLSCQSELLTKCLLPNLYYSPKVERINPWAWMV